MPDKRILVIGDPHSRPESHTERFSALANFIIDKRPDHIVCIGDFADMASLCKYDVGTVNAEGRRYADDIASANVALGLVNNPVRSYSNRVRQNRKKRYDPKFYVTLGNHENRIERAVQQDPKLFGHLSTDDIEFKRYGWEVVPYLSPLEIEGICFQHYFTSGVMGRPIGGHNHARTLIQRNHVSSVCGHSHLRDYSEDANSFGRRVFGLVAGCYDDLGVGYEYTTEQDRFWSGLVLLHEVANGSAEPAWFSYQYILEGWG